MAYRLEHQSSSYISILNKTFENWTNSHPDIFLLSAEGHKIYTPRIVLRFYSSWLSEVFDSFSGSGSGEEVGISLQASSNSIISMMKVLTTGLAVTKVKSDLMEIEGVARSLGIDFQNWQIGSKKKKLPAKSINSNNINVKTSKKTSVKVEKQKQRDDSNTNLNTKDCNICGDGFRDKWKMERHRNTHFNPAATTNKCDLCSLHFKNEEVLSRHVFMLHNNDENGSQVDLFNSLKQENYTNQKASDDDDSTPNVSLNETDPIGDDDNNEREYGCNQCLKTFSKKKNLDKHVLIHSGVKYGCDECSSEFSRKDKLNRHRREKHNASINGNDTVENSIEKEIQDSNFSISDENDDNGEVNDHENVEDATESNVEINAGDLLSEEMEIPDEDLIFD